MVSIFNMSKNSMPLMREYARTPEVVPMPERTFRELFLEFSRGVESGHYRALTASEFMDAMRIEIISSGS